MAELIDLTFTLGSERIPPAQPVPGVTLSEGIKIEDTDTHETNYRSNSRITMSIHVGTHVDVPYHFFPDGLTVDQMPPERFVGPGVLLDLRRRYRERAPITVDDLLSTGVPQNELKDRMAVLFTGWYATEVGTPRVYTDNPYLGEDAARYLVESGARAVAVDFPVNQVHPSVPHTRESAPVHRILLGAAVPIIENLVNQEPLVGRQFELWALPIKLYRGNGGAARVVARILPH